MKEKESLFASVLISINCCVAGSIFGVPWGFVQAGWAFSILLSVFGLICMVSLGMIVIQVLSRMTKLNEYSKKGLKVHHVPFTHLFNPRPASYYITKQSDNNENSSLLPEDHKEYKDPNIKYDFTMICKVLLGKNLEKILNFLIVANNLVFLIGCSSSFAASMAALVPVGPLDTCDIFENPSFLDTCRYKYMFYIGLFSCIVSPMTLLFHFTESTFYLLTVAVTRTILILFMSFLCVVAYVSGTSLGSSEFYEPASVPVNFSYFGVSVPIIFLTMGFHLLIPDVYQALKDKNHNAQKLIVYSFSSAFFLIVLLSLSLAFGCTEVKQLATLNFSGFSFGYSQSERPYWTIVAEFIINLYPCIDVTSIFSMTAVNVADNILALHFDGLDDFVIDKDKVFYMRAYILIISFWLSAYFYDLGVVFALAGSINMVFLFLFVIMFGIASVVLVPEKMQFDNFLAGKKFLIAFLFASLILLTAMWVSFISYLLG